MVDKVIDARVLLQKDVDWGMQHLPYGYQIVANERTFEFLKIAPKDGFRYVIDNRLDDYVVKFEEDQHVQKDS